MRIELDVDELKQKEQALIKELEQVKALLSLMETYGIRASAAETASGANGSAAAAEPEPEPERGHKKHYTQVKGRQRDLLLMLRTGPATEPDLYNTFKWDRTAFRNTMSRAREFGLIRDTNTGKVELTTKGHERADWFSKFPQYQIYQGRFAR